MEWPEYVDIKSDLIPRGIREPLCGWQWVNAHYHDLDGWTPQIEITRPGAKYTITSKDTKALDEAIRIIRR